MSHADFVHLTNRTAYSLAEGALKVEELITLCQKNEMPAVAITDNGNLFGALEFSVTASKSGVQPIIGTTLNIRLDDDQKIEKIRMDVNGHRGSVQRDHLVVLAQNEEGYRNLLDLVSHSFLESHNADEPLVTMADLQGKTNGLIGLTGGVRGSVGRLLLERREEMAESFLKKLHQLFEDRLYVELNRHSLATERQIEGCLIELAYKHGLPLVATNDCHFANEAMYEAHDVLLCIAQSTTISDSKRRQVTPNHRFKTAAEMRRLFSDLPEALDNTLVIARRCSFMPTTRAPILPPFITEPDGSEIKELKNMARVGLENRLKTQVFSSDLDSIAREAVILPYMERLEMELKVIDQMGFPGYFLIVADFIQWAKSKGIPVGPGRGSGAGSVVAWALLITDLDPLRWGLLFERFLNPERVSMPDFDIDFCQDRRNEVIEYVQKKYGQDRVAQIITFGKLQARAVLRDVGRVLEMPYGQVDRICKLVPNNPASPTTLAEAIEGEPDLRKQRDEDESVGTLLTIGLKLEGLYRNASTHAAGIVIADRPLKELVPLYRDPRSEMFATQFNMKWVESAGLVKFDFLGLKTLSVLEKTIHLLKNRDIIVHLQSIPLDDEKTFAMIGRADSIGVFQLESSGMRDVLRKMRPDRFEDIIALVALYRPGPMANIPSYISRKHGDESIEYMHPDLEPVLKETFGIMIYQEQVQQAAQILAGYTLGGADLLRRAMGKKIKSEMDAQRATFVAGALERGVPSHQASSIFENIAAFAGYGFNKSHAAAYALVAYQTAYMKANYPVEFLAASMNYDMGNVEKLNVFRQELFKLQINLLPPNINYSGREFLVEKQTDGSLAIRYALAAIKNVGSNAMRVLEHEREKNGIFDGLNDFINRLDGRLINKRILENLIRAGSLDELNNNRAQLLEGVDSIVKLSNAAAEARTSNQENLFENVVSLEPELVKLPATLDWPPLERLRNEFDAIGFYMSAHPLDGHEDALERMDVVQAAAIGSIITAKDSLSRINVAGIIMSVRIRTNQRGNKYAFVQVSDRSGIFELTVFSEILAESRDILINGSGVFVRCDCRVEDGGMRLTANKIQALEDVFQLNTKGLKIYLREFEPIPILAKLLGDHSNGHIDIKIVVKTESEEVNVSLEQKYSIDSSIRSAVKSLPGIIDVTDL